MTSVVCCERNRWRIVPFLVLFFVTVAVLLGVYRFRDAFKAEENSRQTQVTRPRRPSKLRNWEDAPTYDRWLVVSSEQDQEYLCALIDVSIELNWRPLIVGNNVTCCRKACVLVDDVKVESSKYSIAAYYKNHTIIRRNVAYLYAIEHGARHIFDAYPETFIASGVQVPHFKSEMHRQLLHLALDVALGLVLERPYMKRIYNPYAHFGRNDLWTNGFRRVNARDTPHHNYRICELRPPSIEKFMEIDDGFIDVAAPPLTLPGAILAPFSSKNALYSLEAFWGLALLPGKENDMPAHLRRSLWNQALLGNIAGSVKLSLSATPTIPSRPNKNHKNPAELRETADGFASYLMKWSCASRTSLGCIQDLAKNMQSLNYISAWEAAFLEHWITDLKHLRYLEPPIIRRGNTNPCLGADGLYGVAFYPALAPKNLSDEIKQHRKTAFARFIPDEQLLESFKKPAPAEILSAGTTKKVVSINADGDNKTHMDVFVVADENGNGKAEVPIIRLEEKITTFGRYDELGGEIYRPQKPLEPSEFTGGSSKTLSKESADNMCPGFSTFYPYTANVTFDRTLLIISITSSRFELIPMFETIYRQQFKNILYCGAPHDSIEIFLKKYQTAEDRSFTFLPTHTKYSYECLIGAFEMGYNVDGYLMTTDDTLIETWNMPYQNSTKIWFGGDKNAKITARDWRSVDPGAQKIPRSAEGTLKALEFLKNALTGSYEEPTLTKLSKRSIDVVVRNDNVEASFHELSKDEYEVLDDEVASQDGNREKVIHEPTVEETLERVHSDHEDDMAANHNQSEMSDDRSSFQEADPGKNITIGNPNENNLDLDPSEEALNNNTTVNLQEVTTRDQNKEVQPVAEQDDKIPSTEDDVDDTDEEPEDSERPVSELLRKILVATRNSTHETSFVPSLSTQTTPTTTPTMDDTVDRYQEMPPDNSINISSPLTEDDLVLPIKDNWNPIPTGSIFLTGNDSLNPWLEKTPENKTLDNSSVHLLDLQANGETVTMPGNVHLSELIPDPLSRENASEVISHMQDVKLNNSETSPTPFPVLVGPSVSFNLNTNASVPREGHSLDEPMKKQPSVKTEEERKSPEGHVEELFGKLAENYKQIKLNLGLSSEEGHPNENIGKVEDFDRMPYRLSPGKLRFFACEKGSNMEFCKITSEFLFQLTENIGNDFRLFYDKVPMYYIPVGHQLKFYLISTLLLQHGVTDEFAIPLILRGLAPEKDWVSLEKSSFGAKVTENSSKYPLFHSSASFLHPVDLNNVFNNNRIQTVFCIKYLLRILKN